MLKLTLTEGTQLKIGDNVRIFFQKDSVPGRIKVAVDAPRDVRIERVQEKEKSK